jgi:hypothetical protein
MFVVLAAFIVRPVAFKYRSKRDRALADGLGLGACLPGGAVPALIFGVAVGNVMQGVPFHLTDTICTPMYDGGTGHAKFLGLLDPFALLVGVVSLSMLLMHGAAWLGLKAEGGDRGPRAPLRHHRRGLVASGGLRPGRLWLAVGIEGYAHRRRLPDRPARPTRCMSEVEKTAAGSPPMRDGPGSPLPPSWALPAPPWRSAACGRARGLDAAVVQARHLRRDLDGRADDVPVHPALDRGPEQSSLTVWDSSSRT